MAARQLWLFLTEPDVRSVLTMLEEREPGLVWSQGRYLCGDPADLLAEPAKLERRESLPGERRLYLLHRKHSAEVLAHPQPAGPFAGWAQIDEERTDALVLRIPEGRPDEIQPARLYAHTSYWRAGEKIRKRPWDAKAMIQATFNIWRGDASGGAFKTYTADVSWSRGPDSRVAPRKG